jgi:hypothetical protein
MFSCLRDAFGPMNSAFVAPETKKKAHGDEHKKKPVAVWNAFQVSPREGANNLLRP